MKKKVFTLVFLFTALTFGHAATIVATINPYFLIAKQIVADKMHVELLIKPGSNPHTFNPSINDVKILSNASLIIANGLGLDNAYLKNFKNVAFVGESIPKNLLLQGDEDKGEYNPHVWLSLDFLVNYLIPKITQEIIKIDPANETFYQDNSKKLISSLNTLSEKFDNILSNQASSIVILEHPSFLYFFEKYKIKVLSVEEGHGKEPTISHIKEIIQEGKRGRVLGIFIAPQFNSSAIETIAKELNKEPKRLDPLGFSISAKSIYELFENVYKILESSVKVTKE
jgi:zinc transport system substrate-binding protein